MSLLDDLRSIQSAQEPAPTTAGPGQFRRGLRSGYESALGQLNTLAGGVAEKLGADEFARGRYEAALEREQAAQASRPRITDFRDALESPRNFTDYVAGALGSSVPVSLAAGAGALATRGRGAGLVPNLRAGAGATAAIAPLETGEAIQRQQAADPDKEIDLGAAAKTGVLSAGVQSVVPAMVAGQALRPLAGVARQGVGQTVARNLADVPLEAATETAGTALQQAGATAFNPARDTSGDIEELKQAAAGGAAGGLGFAAAGTGVDLARGAGRAATEAPGRLARAGQEALQGAIEAPAVSGSLEALSSASQAALASAKSTPERAQAYFAQVAPDLSAAAQTAAESLRQSTQDQVKRAREIYAAYQAGEYDSLPDELKAQLDKAGRSVGSAANRAFLFTMDAYRKAQTPEGRTELGQQALSATKDLGTRARTAAENLTRRFGPQTQDNDVDTMEQMGDALTVDPTAPPDVIEAGLRQSDERLTAKAGQYVQELLGRADLTPETKDRLQALSQNLGDKASRAFVATQKKAAQARDEGTRLIEQLYAKYGPKESKKSLVGTGADEELPAVAQGVRDEVVRTVVPLINERYPTLMDDPDRINRVAEVLRGAIEATVNGQPLDQTDRSFLRNLIGDENTAGVLRSMYQAMNFSPDAKADQKFFAELNKLDKAERDRRSLRDFVAQNLTEQAQRRVKTTDLNGLIDDIQAYVEGRDTAFRTRDEAEIYQRQIEDSLTQAFGPNVEAVMARFGAARPNQKLTRKEDAPEQEGEFDDGYDTFGSDALGERDTDNLYFGSERKASRKGVKFMESEENSRKLYPNSEPAVTTRVRELKEQYPDRSIEVITAEQYAQGTGTELAPADKNKVVIVARGMENDESISEDTFRKIKADERYKESTSRIKVTDKVTLDAYKVLRLGEQRLKQRGEQMSEDAKARRAQAFAEGLASVSVFLNRPIEVPPNTVVYRNGTEKVTYAQLRAALGKEGAFSSNADGSRDRNDETESITAMSARLEKLESEAAALLDARPSRVEAARERILAALKTAREGNATGVATALQNELDTIERYAALPAKELKDRFDAVVKRGEELRKNLNFAQKQAALEDVKKEKGITELPLDAPIQLAAAEANDGDGRYENPKLVRAVDASGQAFRHSGPKNAFRYRTVTGEDGRPQRQLLGLTEVGRNILDSRAAKLEASTAKKYRDLGAQLRALLGQDLSDKDALELYTATAAPPENASKDVRQFAAANREKVVRKLTEKYAAPAASEPEVSAREKKQRLIERARSSDPKLLEQIAAHAEPKSLQRSADALNDWLDSAEGLSDEDVDNTARVIDAMNDRIRQLVADPDVAYGMTVGSKKSLIGAGQGQHASMVDELVVNGDVYRVGDATVVRADAVAYEGDRQDVAPPKAYYMEGFTEDGDQFSGWFDSEAEVNAALAAEGITGEWQKAVARDDGDDIPFSRVGAGQARITAQQMREVKAYIDKTLAGKMRTEFGRMKYAGEFIAGQDTEGTVRLSVFSLDPMSTAYHEALHGFIHQLKARKQDSVVNELIRAASSPFVVKQLNELLKGEPAALSQLKDPEERAAYMFQFYANGQLKLRDRSARGVIKAITDWVRATLGLWSNEQNALRIMEYFHSGEYAANIGDRSAVGRVLAKGASNAALQKAGEFTKLFAEGADKLASIGHTRLRDTNIPALIEIADRVKRPLTAKGDDPGFLPAARVARTEWLNRFAAIVKDLTPEQLEQTLEALQLGNAQGAKTREARIAAFTIRKQLLDPFYEYLTKDAGVQMGDMGFGKDYFPRVWDPVYISKNMTAFEAMLDKYVAAGAIQASAKQSIVNRIVTGQGAELQIEVDRPGMLNAKARRLAFISAADAAPFVRKDLFSIIDAYITQGTRRAEWTRRFGDEGQHFDQLLDRAAAEGATREQIETAQDYVRGVNGTLGDDFDPRARRVMGDVIVYQNIRLLPLAIFSSVVDPMGVMVNGGSAKDAWNTFKRGVRELSATFKKNPERDSSYELAEMLGTIDNIMLTNVMGQLYSQGMVGDTARKINDAFFKYNLMEQYTLSMRVGATEAAVNFIAKHGDGSASPHSKRWMQELGIDGIVMIDNGRPLLTADQFEKAGLSRDEAVVRANKMKAAVNTWVDGAILRPDAADRPIWFNDPRWVLITHLKQFTYSFHQTILKRVAHEFENGNYKPAMALAGYVPVMLAADLMKGMLQGGGELPEWKKDWTIGDHLAEAGQRAGLLGVAQFAVDGYGGLVGPTISQLTDVAQAVDGRRAFSSVAINAMPANSLYKYWDSDEATGGPARDR